MTKRIERPLCIQCQNEERYAPARRKLGRACLTKNQREERAEKRIGAKRRSHKLKLADNQYLITSVLLFLASGKSKNWIAAKIGVHKNTLYRSLKRMGIQ